MPEEQLFSQTFNFSFPAQSCTSSSCSAAAAALPPGFTYSVSHELLQNHFLSDNDETKQDENRHKPTLVKYLNIMKVDFKFT